MLLFCLLLCPLDRPSPTSLRPRILQVIADETTTATRPPHLLLFFTTFAFFRNFQVNRPSLSLPLFLGEVRELSIGRIAGT